MEFKSTISKLRARFFVFFFSEKIISLANATKKYHSNSKENNAKKNLWILEEIINLLQRILMIEVNFQKEHNVGVIYYEKGVSIFYKKPSSLEGRGGISIADSSTNKKKVMSNHTKTKKGKINKK